MSRLSINYRDSKGYINNMFQLISRPSAINTPLYKNTINFVIDKEV